MARKARPADVQATFSIEGPAAGVLAEARKTRGGKRRAMLCLTLRGADGMRLPESYYLPAIENGNSTTALTLVKSLCAQGRMSLQDRDKICDLIEQFKDAT